MSRRYRRRGRSGTPAANSLIGSLLMLPFQIAGFILVFVCMKVFFAGAIALVGLAGKAADALAAKLSRRELPPPS